MRYDAVIFDVGDTLIEYVPTLVEQYKQRLIAVGYTDVSDEMVQKMVNAAKHAEYAQLIREWNGTPRMDDEPYLRMQYEAALRAVFSEEKVRRYLPVFEENPISFEGKTVRNTARNVLCALRDRGQRLGIVSNDSPRLREYLAMNGLAEFFEMIVISGEEGVEKPDPKIMYMAMQRMGATAERCLYVGDHPFDVLCAKHAGMACAWIAPKETHLPEGLDVKEDYRIGGIEDLLCIHELNGN